MLYYYYIVIIVFKQTIDEYDAEKVLRKTRVTVPSLRPTAGNYYFHIMYICIRKRINSVTTTVRLVTQNLNYVLCYYHYFNFYSAVLYKVYNSKIFDRSRKEY